jgi:hypothetical protein
VRIFIAITTKISTQSRTLPSDFFTHPF